MDLSRLYELPRGVETRWASPENVWGQKGGGGKAAHGRKGSAYFFVKAGETLTLAQVRGRSGVIRRMWCTFHDLSPRMLKQLRLEMFWDGAESPAVSVPLGDFFGMGLGRMAAFEGALFSSPEGRSFNCFIPMPFHSGMKVTLTNDGAGTANFFYYDIDYTLGDDVPEDAPTFHAWYNQQLPTRRGEDYAVLESVCGRGRYLGAHFAVAMDRERYAASWGGEGEAKFYIDGDGEHPTLCGTGTEDYIGTGWCQGVFSHRSQGCTVADDEKMHLCFYRYHLADPIYFATSLRAAFQQIGSWNPGLLAHFAENDIPLWRAGPLSRGPGDRVDPADPLLPPFDLFEREDCWSSCCYFYLDAPTHDLPALPPFAQRLQSIPGFDWKELETVQDEHPQITLIKRYIPNIESLSLQEIEALALALQAVKTVLGWQQEALTPPEGDG